VPIGRVATLLSIACCILLSGARHQPQIVATNQVSGTTALLIGVSPVNDSIVWVSGTQGTWLRTLNGGATWQSGRVIGAESLQFRDVHGVDANTAYLLSIGNGEQSRIYKTTDGGQRWTLQFRNLEERSFLDCMDFWDARRGLVIEDALDYRVLILGTIDGGANWHHNQSTSLPMAQTGEGSFAASGTCLVTRPGGHAWIVASNPQYARLFHTMNYGQTWAVDTLPVTVRAGFGPQSVTFRDDNNGMVLAGGTGGQTGDVLTAITRDGGNTWIPRARPPLATGVWGGVYIPGSSPPTVVAVGPSGSVYSQDDGASWTTIDNLNYWSVAFSSPGSGWAVGQRGRITKISGFR
jgi:photosystem II stability/assembly factor-like uncharacterized protein